MADDLEELKRRLVVGHKRDGRSVYDATAKSELVALCLQPGASVSRLARDCGVNANQVSRWLREHGHGRRARAAVVNVVSTPSAFMAVPVVATPAAPADGDDSAPEAVSLQARLPNGVSIDLRGVDHRHVGGLIEALGRLRCSASTKA
jgi:transposase